MKQLILSDVPSVLLSSESNEWYTPPAYVDAAREVMRGTIDLDPASCERANRVVKATAYYDKRTDGLTKPWPGRVWLNPPYSIENGKSNQERWSCRLIAQYEAGITTEAVLLVNAVTGNSWFQRLWNYSICFTDHRIRFYSEEVEAGQPTHSNALVYFGKNTARFIDVFREFGAVIPSGAIVRKRNAAPSLWEVAS